MYELLQPHILEALSLIITVMISLAARQFHKWTGIQIEEKHQRALHSAFQTGAKAAISGGAKAGMSATADEVIAYVRQSVPDALSALRPSPDAMRKLAARYVGGAK